MAVTVYESWRDFPPGEWRWPDFSPEEIACRGDGTLLVNAQALDRLQGLRERIGKPLIVQSAYRSPSWNKKVGGAKSSQHLYARAFDISMSNHDPAAFEQLAREAGFTGFGFYVKQNFMHIDIGPAREWGKRFKPRPVTEHVEIDVPDEPLEADRFAEEPKKPTIIESLSKPEVLIPVGTAGGTGALKLAENSWIVQAGIAVGFVALVVGGVIWIVMRNRRVRAGD